MPPRTLVIYRPAVVPPADETEARRRRRDRAIRRDLLILLAVVLGLAVAWPLRQVPNPDLPLAEGLTARMETTYRAVRAGELTLSPEPDDVVPGIRGLHVERPTGDRWVLAGEAGSDCYALWWDADGLRRPRTVPDRLPCEPSATLTTPMRGSFDRVGRAVPEADPASAWGPVLPAPEVLRWWYLPAVILAGAIGLGALVRISIAFLTGDTPAATRR